MTGTETARGAQRRQCGVKIGLLVPRTGPAGLWAPTCEASTMLAAAELNAADGVAGRAVTVAIADSGTDPTMARASIRRLLGEERVDAIVGMHPSDVREAITAAIGGRVPYVYTATYEGGELGPGVLPIGSIDHDLLGRAIPWLMTRRRADRFFILGNDYLWPRRSALSAARIVAAHGARVAGVKFVPIGETDCPDVLEAVRRSGADVLITLLLGAETVAFSRAFAAAGLQRTMLRLCLATDETVLYGAGAECHENLYAATTYTADLAGARHERFRELYREGFGTAMPAATVFGQACYDGVHLLAALARPAARRASDEDATLRGRFAVLTRAGGTRAAVNRAIGAPLPQIHLVEADGLRFRVRR